MAKEWGHLNVRCNAIAYGWIDTRLTRSKEGGEAILVGGEKVGVADVVLLQYSTAAWMGTARLSTIVSSEHALQCAVLLLPGHDQCSTLPS